MLYLNNVSFSYDGKPVLEEIDLKVGEGQHLAVIGESGCGKSTLLKIIYGLLQIDSGEVYWNDIPVKGPLYNLVPGESYMKYLAQDFHLMPYTTVRENIGRFLSVRQPVRSKARVDELLEMMELTAFADSKVLSLSGGQQQRVALARVLALEPKLLLLDEPFGPIDNFMRRPLRRKIFDHLRDAGITCITATHDMQDVLPFADRAIVLKDHRILANDSPTELYQHPRNFYVASLFGEANRIPVNIVKSYADTTRHIIVYAHEFKVSQQSGIPVKVVRVYPMGSYFLVQGTTNGQSLYFHHDQPLELGKGVYLNVSIQTLNRRLKP